MLKMSKKVLCLVMALTMLCGLSITTLAAETLEPIGLDGLPDSKIVLSESPVNETLSSGTDGPVFYSGKVYGYNSKTKTREPFPAGEVTWNWGTNNPTYIEFPKEIYWDLSAKGCDSWYFQYTWNSKDSTYLKIYDRDNSNVYINRTVKPNTQYTFSFIYPDTLTSQVRLRCDYTLPGVMTVKDLQIGGLKVIY